MTAPRLGLIGQLNEAAALVAGAGLDAWDALAAGADAPRARLLNVRARVALARERLQRVKGSEVAAAAALDLAGVDALAALDASEATLAAVARRLHAEAHGLWMTLTEGERERLREAQDAASETVDGYLSKRERALDRAAALGEARRPMLEVTRETAPGVGAHRYVVMLVRGERHKLPEAQLSALRDVKAGKKPNKDAQMKLKKWLRARDLTADLDALDVRGL